MLIPPVAYDQHGLFTREQAAVAGFSKGAVDRLLASGRLLALAPGVYGAAPHIEGLVRRDRHLLEARALVLAHGDSWHLARRTAAVAYGLPLLGRAPAAVQLTRNRTTSRVRSSSRHRHINGLSDAERTVCEGLPVTTLARTVFDIARRETLRSALVVTDAALRAGLRSLDVMALVDLHPRWPGVGKVRRVLAFADGRAESPLESLGRLTCLEEDLPVFEPQVEVLVDGELIARVDGLWWDRLVVFEGDGGMKFDRAGVLPALLTRQERLREAGLPVVRASWDDVTRRRGQWAQGARQELADNPGRPRANVTLRSTSVRITPLDASDHYRWPPLVSPTPRSETAREWFQRGAA
jgi:hypothetical protein